MKILIIGAGMYVTGREGTGTGTILSSLAESSRAISVDEVTVVATNPANDMIVAETTCRINAAIGTALKTSYRTIAGDAATDIPTLCAENRYDCAIISVPDHLHFAYTRALLEQGVPCLVVKPLTPTLAEARELEHLSRERGVYGAVEFHKRWDVTNLWIKRAICERKLGKLLYFAVDYSQKITIPLTTFKRWSDKTNIFQYLGVHYVDLIWFLTGCLPVRAMGIGTDGILKRQGIETWDSVHALILWQNPDEPEDRFLSNFNTNWIDPACTSAMSDQKYKVVGTSGRIECDQKNRGVELVHETFGIQQVNPYFSDYLPDGTGRLRFCGYGHESINCFLEDIVALNSGATSLAILDESRPTLRCSLVSTAVVDAVNLSLIEGFVWKEIDEIF